MLPWYLFDISSVCQTQCPSSPTCQRSICATKPQGGSSSGKICWSISCIAESCADCFPTGKWKCFLSTCMGLLEVVCCVIWKAKTCGTISLVPVTHDHNWWPGPSRSFISSDPPSSGFQRAVPQKNPQTSNPTMFSQNHRHNRYFSCLRAAPKHSPRQNLNRINKAHWYEHNYFQLHSAWHSCLQKNHLIVVECTSPEANSNSRKKEELPSFSLSFFLCSKQCSTSFKYQRLASFCPN